MTSDHLSVHADDHVGRIAPEIYGHFAEHLGRCIYDGIWVGEDADVANRDGLRAETVDLLDALDMPVLRWPGGCFADDYDWRDGVGPREERPRRRNLWWAQGTEEVFEEPNTFGTEEFLRLCREVDTEPYLAINVGSGDPGDALDWVEYCNYDGDTENADLRRAQGSEEPHGVVYWGVGNENWGCGGRYDPDDYAREYRRYANYLRGYQRMGDTELELIACGHTGHAAENWNREFMDAVGDPSMLDHLSVHRYYESGGDVEFDEEQYYRLFASAAQVADDVDRAAEVLDVYAPGTDVGVIVDEWGVWHPEATAENGLEQENTVRDALSAAGVLDLFNERADVVTMANLAQTVNVLQCVVQTNEEAAWATPTYHVLDLYAPHAGRTAVRTVVDTDVREVDAEEHDVPMVSASASVDEGSLYLTASNRDLDADREVRVSVPEATPEAATATALFADSDPADYSTPENAASFAPEDHAVDVDGGEVVVDVPASAVVGVDVDLA